MGLGGDSVVLGSIHCESRWTPLVSLRVVGSLWESMGLIRIDSTHLGLGGDSVALGSIHCESRWSPGES